MLSQAGDLTKQEPLESPAQSSPLASDIWVRRTRTSPHARVRLFCLPYAGGGASIYRQWSENLPETIDVCPVQLPGREQRFKETLFTQLDPLCEALADALQTYFNLPFAIYGHSLGALIGFELARKVRQQYDLSPSHLFVGGYSAPQLPTPLPGIHDLAEPQFIAELRQLQGVPEQILTNPDLRELFIPLLRADFSVSETYEYRHEAPLSCPIIVFGGQQDRTVNREAIEAWRQQTDGRFSVWLFPGDHFFIHTMEKPILQVIAQELSPFLSV